MKRIDYEDPKVSGLLLVGVIFIISSYSFGYASFIMGVIFILSAMKLNNKIS